MKKHLLTTVFALATVCAFAQPCTPNTHSLFLNGTSSYVSVSNQAGLDIADSITVEAWINVTAFGITSAQNSVVCKHGWSQGEAGYVLRIGGSGELSFNFAGLDINGIPVSWVDNISPTGTLTTATWYHVAGTFDGTQSKIYVNGVLKGTTPFTGTMLPSPSYPLTIGRLADPGQPAGRYFNGYIDEVRIWHRALPQTEIQANMSVHLDTTTALTGLVSYWRMNNGTGTTVTDLAGGDNTGNTNNIIWSTTVPFNAAPPTPGITFSGGTLFSNAPTNNQWFLNGVAIAGATNVSYTPTVNGAYTVVVTNATGCTASSNPYNITSLGINDLNKNVVVNAYTVAGKLTLNLYCTLAQPNTNIKVFDMSGRLAEQVTNIHLMSGDNTIRLTKKHTKGIYFFEVSNNNEVLAKGKWRCE